jgi:hypothetical protein
MFNLNSGLINQVADYVEFVEEVMNMDNDDILEPYVDWLTDIIRNANRSTSRERIYAGAGGNMIRANRITFTFSQDDLAEILTNLHAILSEDDTLRSTFSAIDMLDNSNSSSFDSMLADVIYARNRIRHDGTGIAISVYTGSRNRIVQVTMETSEGRMVLNLGEDAQDTWSYSDQWNTLIWDMDRSGNSYMHVISYIDNWGSDTMELTWNTNNGNFTATLDGDSITGNFTTDNRGRDFRLSLDALPMNRNETISLIITGTPDVDISRIEYVSMRDWGGHLIQNIQAAMWDLIMGRFF